MENKIPFKREVNQELFFNILGQVWGDMITDGEREYKKENFVIREYDWNEPEEPEPNLYHKPSGFKLWWYKHPLRSPEVNMDISFEQFRAILWDIRNEIAGYRRFDTYEEWWKSGK